MHQIRNHIISMHGTSIAVHQMQRNLCLWKMSLWSPQGCGQPQPYFPVPFHWLSWPSYRHCIDKGRYVDMISPHLSFWNTQMAVLRQPYHHTMLTTMPFFFNKLYRIQYRKNLRVIYFFFASNVPASDSNTRTNDAAQANQRKRYVDVLIHDDDRSVK